MFVRSNECSNAAKFVWALLCTYAHVHRLFCMSYGCRYVSWEMVQSYSETFVTLALIVNLVCYTQVLILHNYGLAT